MRIGTILKHIFATSLLAATSSASWALDASHYAQHSVLSEGKWATVEVSETGMTLITDAMLRNLGFSDPSKVRVYGTGGSMAAEALDASMPDDLPIVPSVRTSRGIVFFARDNHTWAPRDGVRPYAHTINPYTEKSVYFISDSDTGRTVGELNLQGGSTADVTTFVNRQVHEQELAHLGESGRTYLGEDFRGTRSQTFDFKLPDLTDGEATVSIRFGAKVSSGGSRLTYRIGDRAIPRASEDSIAGVDASQYAAFSTRSFTAPVDADKLALNIGYTNSGVLFLARLDYIEVFHNRSLRLNGGQLHFYGTWQAGQTLGVTGASQSTVIYDVTDPAHPAVVAYTLQGDRALLRLERGGYREFVAFDPEKISTGKSRIGRRIANQDLHALEAPDMLIISPDEYRDGAQLIADMHQSLDGMQVTVLSPEIIYNEFSGGIPDVSAWRKLLKMWHDRGRAPQYCLIMGKPSFDPKGKTSDFKNMRYNPVPIWQSSDGLSETTSYSNDDYIGMLDDVTASDFQIGRAIIHVAVGRIPAKSADEARTMAQKIVNHVTKPVYGSWRNKVMFIADDDDKAVHLDDSQKSYNNMRASGRGAAYLYDRLYIDSYPLVTTALGQTYPQATRRMLDNYNEGVVFTNYLGHASERGWGHEKLWVWDDIVGIKNPNLTFMYTGTCRFMPWDEPIVSAAEELMLNPRGGVAGMISTSRTVFISANGTLNGYVTSEIFKNGSDGRMLPIGLAYINGKNKYVGDDNKLRYALMGDPAMRLNNIRNTVSIDSIAGTELAGTTEPPEITAGSRLDVAGCIRTPEGNVDTDFNGTISLQLYDAETVVETYGNGKTGESRMYNDRKTRLGSINASVKQGRFNCCLTVPMEISNNYQPALLSAYAWTDRGIEANGYSESLYVYGFPDTADTDTIGPKIEYFYLNTDRFAEGDAVNPNPVVFVRLSDPAGINVSDAGVGHRISLILDKKHPYDDVSQHFVPDVDDTGGTVAYALQDLTAGEHTLTLEAWDNLNNSTRSTISFKVNATADPRIVNVGTDCNPATSGVTFHISLDQPNTDMKCDLDVMDLNGRVIWSNTTSDTTGLSSSLSTYWNLCDKSGSRVPRGIYLYRVRVETPQGNWASKTNKLAVTAQ